jgi:hypothetical protein
MTALLLDGSIPLDAAYRGLADHRVPLPQAIDRFARANAHADRFTLFMATRMAMAERRAGESAASLSRWEDDGGRCA